MKINVATQVKTLRGEVIKDPSGQPVTIRDLIVQVLLAVKDNDTSNGATKFRRFTLASKIAGHAGDEVTVTLEDASLIKDASGSILPPLLLGRLWEALEGSESPPPV